MMAFTADGDMAGSVSGGCVEGAVAQVASEVLENGQTQVIPFTATYQVAWDVGLACGGEIEVVVQRLDTRRHNAEKQALSKDRGYTRLLLVSGNDNLLGATMLIDDEGLLYTDLDDETTPILRAVVEKLPLTKTCGTVDIATSAGPMTFAFSRERTRPQLICVGATHVAIFLTQIADPLGYSTVVIDPRGLFVTEKRFPHVDTLLHLWPQEAFSQIDVTRETAICILTHDPKIDVPALEYALASPAFYVGSLGRPSTQKQRYRSLVNRGIRHESIQRVFGPIGLDLGGRSPEEVALAIFAEITAVRYGRDGASRRMHEFAPGNTSAIRQAV
jgi:xanthine dehydrogenase accessory factor